MMDYRKNIFLTGHPGVGKTTLIHKVLSLMSREGREDRAAGFISSLKNRPDVTLIQVTEANRNQLPRVLAEALKLRNSS